MKNLRAPFAILSVRVEFAAALLLDAGLTEEAEHQRRLAISGNHHHHRRRRSRRRRPWQAGGGHLIIMVCSRFLLLYNEIALNLDIDFRSIDHLSQRSSSSSSSSSVAASRFVDCNDAMQNGAATTASFQCSQCLIIIILVIVININVFYKFQLAR